MWCTQQGRQQTQATRYRPMSIAEPTHAPEVALIPKSKILGPFAHYDIVPIYTASSSFQTSKAIYQKAKSKAVDRLGGVIPAHVLQARSTPDPPTRSVLTAMARTARKSHSIPFCSVLARDERVEDQLVKEFLRDESGTGARGTRELFPSAIPCHLWMLTLTLVNQCHTRLRGTNA